MKAFRNGLTTGLILQLAVGPVFFFIMSLVLSISFLNGIAGVIAVTLVDYFYITLAIFGIGKLLENKKVKKIFGAISSIVLAIFGIIIIKSVGAGIGTSSTVISSSLFSSFASVFILTISSPMTIVFFTSLFTTKALEYNYTKKELIIFGLGTGLATFLFMGLAAIIFSLIKGSIPTVLVQILNFMVGGLLIGYGVVRLVKIFRTNKIDLSAINI